MSDFILHSAPLTERTSPHPLLQVGKPNLSGEARLLDTHSSLPEISSSFHHSRLTLALLSKCSASTKLNFGIIVGIRV